MELYFKKPSIEARKAMCDAVNSSMPKNHFIKSAEESLCKLTGYKYSKVVNSGNSAIFQVMGRIQGSIMVPDQGAWSGFIKIAKFLGKDVKYLPTELGLINTEDLSTSLQNERPKALFITSLAGYTAEQPVKEIHKICDDADVILVEDASGSLGDNSGKLANCKHSDVIVASTGSPKIVNVGNGGIISTNQKELLESTFKFLEADPVTCAGITPELTIAPTTFRKTVRACQYLKKELNEVIHEDLRGINVILKADNTKILAKELRNSINVNGGGMISRCPRYDRILEKGVVLEIKNLDLRCLTSENLDWIVNITHKLRDAKRYNQ